MRPSVSVNWTRVGRALAAQVVALLSATAVIAVLEHGFGLRQASSVYLLAVAAVAIGFGSWAAAGTAIGAFLIYNFLFIQPLYTFRVTQPDGILTLFLLLVLGIVLGRLTGMERERRQEAQRREREATALFAISRALATARRARDAFQPIVSRLAGETRMSRIWIGLGPTTVREQVAAGSDGGQAPSIGAHYRLRRTPDERRSDWVRVNPSTPVAGPRQNPSQAYRVPLLDGAEEIGSLWALRDRAAGSPDIEETRLLAAAADQVGQAVLRDRLAAQATEMEIAQRSDELKTALLDSVSHDLRTPLATIRAAAGSLADAEISLPPAEQHATARQIDLEAERLNRIVSNLLDMSRIQAGSLRPQSEILPVDEVLHELVRRTRGLLEPRPISVEVPDDLVPVVADPVLLDEALTNLVENVARYTPASAPVLFSAQELGGKVVVSVEDGGPGVPADALERIFDRFYRHRPTGATGGRGTGLGLAVVRGMVEAMGGTVVATASELGGLAVRVELPAGSATHPGEAASDRRERSPR